MVNAFVFRSAKNNIDKITKNSRKTDNHDGSSIVSGSYQDQTGIVPVSYQSKTVIGSPSDQEKIISGSYQDQDHITTVPLSARQQQVYDWLLENGLKGTFTKPQIQIATGIPYITIRKALIKFQNTGILTLKYDTCQKITSYQFNSDKQIQKYQKDQDQDQNGSGSYQDQNSSLISSSSFSIKNTSAVEIELILADHPEFGYWRQKGLTAKQVSEWIKMAKCSVENMIQYLCYCRFDMVDMGVEESKPIANVFNWFFRVLEKSGGYPKPKGYKSHQEKQIEQEKAAVAKKEQEIEDLKKVWRQKYEKERELEFWQIMNNPEGEEYKNCFDRLNHFMKKKEKKGGPAFEAAMQAAFNEMIEASDADDDYNSNDQKIPSETEGN